MNLRLPILPLGSILWLVMSTSGVGREAEVSIVSLLKKAKALKSQDMTSRVDFFSRSLLGSPYLDAPTGDGPRDRYDNAPMFRLDAFDCTTYVETVLALSASKSPLEFEKWIQKIRYQGKPSFLTRNHFPCTEWLPNNQNLGFLTDITAKVGAKWEVQYATAAVDRKTWFQTLTSKVIRNDQLSAAEKESRLTELKAAAKRFSKTSPSVPYVTLSSFIQSKPVSEEQKAQRAAEEAAFTREKSEELRKDPKIAATDLDELVHAKVIDLRLRYLIQETTVQREFIDAIPSGTLLNVVRPGWSVPGTKMNISHQGFVIRKGNETYFRHTSRTGKRAKDVLLENYLRLCLLVPSIKGINLLAVQSPMPLMAKKPRRGKR